MAADVTRQRREILFSGRVQGVGFRYTVRNIAGRFDVTGFVQNLPDGRVRLLAEGAADQLDCFLAAIEAEMSHYIAGKQQRISPPTGEFASFGIRF